jgi:hypothetical protein
VTYPASQLDQPDRILALLGSLWSETYDGQDVVERLVAGRADLAKNTFGVLRDAAATRSRLQCPLFRVDGHRHAPVLRSQAVARAARFGGRVEFGDGYRFGSAFEDWVAYPAPADLAGVKVITNRLTEPSAVLFYGLDFWLEGGYLVFRVDPFNDDRFARKGLTDEGVEVDQELDLWLDRPEFERHYVRDHWGHVAGAEADSSQGYKNLVNGLFDMLVLGSSSGLAVDAVALALGVPLAKGGETVTEVTADGLHTLVLTDKNAYRLSLESTAAVAAGDALEAGDPLCDAVRLYEFNRSQLPATLLGLTLGPGFLLGKYVGEVGFPNRDVPLKVETVGGYTKVSCELGGHPADVATFWADVHARGIARGRTLAQALDRRDDPEGEPQPENLPATINPLDLIADSALRYNAFVVRAQVGESTEDAAGLWLLAAAQRLVPPHTAMILLLDAPRVVDELAIGGADDEIDSFDAAETYEHTAWDVSPEVITARPVSGFCQ